MNKPKSVIFLMVFFGWSAGAGLDSIVKFTVLADYNIYLANGVPWVFFAFSIPIFGLNILTLYSLFTPHWLGLYFALSSLAMSVIHNTSSLLLSLKDLPAAKETYAISREARGLTVRDEAMDKIFSTNVMLSTMVVMFIFYAVVAFYVYKNRDYFSGNQPSIKA